MGGIDRGRAAFDRRAWANAYEELSAAAHDEPLEVQDLERLACAARLVGRARESSDVWTHAHQECARAGDVTGAVRCAFWLAFCLLNNGEIGRGGGWVDRAERLLDGAGGDRVERGYLRYLSALRSIFSGDVPAARSAFREAVALGERFGDAELAALARIGEGRTLIYLGEVDRGLRLLDEAMVAISTHEVSPIAMGDAYCTVIDGCQELFELRRAREWTAALSRWCDAQPDLVLYHGRCLIHRAELMQLGGAWSDAEEELDRALRRLADPPGQPALAEASYLRGELHRLRGELARAEEAYRTASGQGRDPQPGLALLRLAQGRVDAAVAAIRRLLDEAEGDVARARVLGPYAEIALASGDVAAARAAADELAVIAGRLGRPYLEALAGHVAGAVLLEEGDVQGALPSLRRAWRTWRELEAPYEAARARVLIARACRALGDDDGAELELDAARSAFSALGATLDAAGAGSLSRLAPGRLPGGLTPREAEVLALVARGTSNRGIAAALVISEKTVASHLSHIFTKLGITSRAAAAGYAYEHGLV
jgi:DNA-binding CsgD family transcriptional regulator